MNTRTRRPDRLNEQHVAFTLTMTVGWDDWNNEPITEEGRPVYCGDWYMDGTEICDECMPYYRAWYPQGWAYYPGDICKHGTYTGGSGIDWMCGPCEMGE